jgi:hypothetical protein
MLTTLNSISEHIAFLLKEPLNIELRQNIKASVKYWRAALIRRDVTRNGLSDEFLQRIYIDLIKVDKADACNFNLDCLILKTKIEIPKPIRLNNDILFKFVGTVNGKPFTFVEYEEIPYTAYNKFTSKVIRYNYTNNYIYIFGNTKLKKLAIQAIFSNPEDINTSCDILDCYNDDKPFPIAEDMLQQIVQGILSTEYRLINQGDDEVEIDTDINKRNNEQ